MFLVGAWVLFIYLAIKASQVEKDHIDYDPYDILELDRVSSRNSIPLVTSQCLSWTEVR